MDDGTLVVSKPYRVSLFECETKSKIINEWKVPYASSVQLVSNKNLNARLVVDYRKLNTQTRKVFMEKAKGTSALPPRNFRKMFKSDIKFQIFVINRLRIKKFYLQKTSKPPLQKKYLNALLTETVRKIYPTPNLDEYLEVYMEQKYLPYSIFL